jgi:hypothetical protein
MSRLSFKQLLSLSRHAKTQLWTRIKTIFGITRLSVEPLLMLSLRAETLSFKPYLRLFGMLTAETRFELLLMDFFACRDSLLNIYQGILGISRLSFELLSRLSKNFETQFWLLSRIFWYLETQFLVPWDSVSDHCRDFFRMSRLSFRSWLRPRPGVPTCQIGPT